MFKLLKLGVKRLMDGAFIPPDIRNTDWQEFQAWLAAGNTPQPADPDPTPIDQSDLDQITKQMKALALCIAQVGGLTVPQMRALFKQKYDSLP